jgi:hypothetical protein
MPMLVPMGNHSAVGRGGRGWVVRTAPAAGEQGRLALSRLSPWWSWLTSTASIAPRSVAAIAGPVSFRKLEPQPKL